MSEVGAWLAARALGIAIWAAARLPIDSVSRLGGFLGARFGPWTRRNKRVLSNIAVAFPQVSHAERGRIARGMWDNFGRTVAESLIVGRIAADPRRVVFDDEDWVRTRIAELHGAVFVGAHFGNWEVAVVPALRLGQKPIGIYKPLKNSDANRLLLDLRKDIYPAGLLPTTKTTVLTVTRHVRSGGTVCLLADHRDRSGVVVPFFGRPAPSATVPALLAVTFGLPILAARVDRLKDANFRVHVEEVDVSRTGNKTADVQHTTAAIQAIFETWIGQRPECWVWCYKRWIGDGGDAMRDASQHAPLSPQ
ncbi:MAG: lysophospholipid acyltransferase family protein [Hyphomicrobiaceae bacterium]